MRPHEPPRGLAAPGCSATTGTGEPCRAAVVAGSVPPRCRFHPADEEGRQRLRAMSAAGGRAPKGGGTPPASAAPMAEAAPGALTVEALEHPAGLRLVVAAALAQLTGLPFTPAVAHAVAALVGAQAKIIEQHDLEERISTLERISKVKASPWPR